jgi:hypothetical protein
MTWGDSSAATPRPGESGGGGQLLVFRSGPRWHHVTAAGINDYIRELSGGDYTAKDFRTWHATVLAAVGLAVSGQARTESARKRAIARVVAEVAAYLGNTPAVARASYIDPRVIRHYENGRTIAAVLGDLSRDSDFGDLATRGRAESAVLRLLAVPAQPRTRSAKDLDLAERVRGSTGRAAHDRVGRKATPCVAGSHSSSSARRVRALRTAFASPSLLKYTNTSWPARSHSPIRLAHQRRSASG